MSGSTKSAIVDAAEQYLAGKPVRFVGAHPMAGSTRQGLLLRMSIFLKMPIISSRLRD